MSMTQMQKSPPAHPTVRWVKAAFQSDEVISRIQEVMPRGVSAKRIMRTATAAVAADPYLQKCEPGSILRAVMRLAQVGLEPNTPLNQAYLVPYGQKCEPVLGYRGMIELARRSGQIVSIESRAAFEGDTFEYEYGLNPRLVHRPAGEMDAAKLTHVYAVASLEGGGRQWDVMSRAEVDRIRTRALANKKNIGASPWTTDYVEMGKKTVLRRLWKLLPISIHAQALAEREEAMVRGVDPAEDSTELEAVIDAADAAAPEERTEADQAHRQAQGIGPTEDQEFAEWAAQIRETTEPRELAAVVNKIGKANLPIELQQRLTAVVKDQEKKFGGGR